MMISRFLFRQAAPIKRSPSTAASFADMVLEVDAAADVGEVEAIETILSIAEVEALSTHQLQHLVGIVTSFTGTGLIRIRG